MKQGKGKPKLGRPFLAAIADHQRTGDPVAVLRDGKAVSISADQIRVSEPEVGYENRLKKATRPRNTRAIHKKKDM